jgi:hypothetical protein
MTTFHFQTQVSSGGMITLPPLPETFYGENVTVKVNVRVEPDEWGDDDDGPDPARILPNGKTVIDDFLDFCKGLNIPPMTDEEIDQLRYDALKEKYGL